MNFVYIHNNTRHPTVAHEREMKQATTNREEEMKS